MNNNFTNTNEFDKINQRASNVISNVVQRGQKQRETTSRIIANTVKRNNSGSTSGMNFTDLNTPAFKKSQNIIIENANKQLNTSNNNNKPNYSNNVPTNSKPVSNNNDTVSSKNNNPSNTVKAPKNKAENLFKSDTQNSSAKNAIMYEPSSGELINKGFSVVGQNESKDDYITDYKLSDKGAEFIKNYEGGYHKDSYDASGVKRENDMTIGYGHKLQDGEITSNMTEEEAQRLFEKDVEMMINTTFLKFLEENNIKLTQNQFDAMLSFTFNHGQNLWGNDEASSREAMKKFLKDGDYSQEAIQKAFATYMGENAEEGHVARRNDEIEMFLYGDYERDYDYTRPKEK